MLVEVGIPACKVMLLVPASAAAQAGIPPIAMSNAAVIRFGRKASKESTFSKGWTTAFERLFTGISKHLPFHFVTASTKSIPLHVINDDLADFDGFFCKNQISADWSFGK
jgi:hypothetical protein